MTAEKTFVSATGTESVLLHIDPNSHDYQQQERNVTGDISRRLVGNLYAAPDPESLPFQYPNEIVYLHQGTYTSLLGTNVRFSEHYAISGASGSEIQIISPPFLPPLDGRTARTVSNSQLNFGIAVDIDALTDVIVVGANAYFYYTGMIYIYHPFVNQSLGGNLTWVLNTTIQSPLGFNTGFGHSVGIDNGTIIVGTSSQSGHVCIYGYRNDLYSWQLVESFASPSGAEKSHFGFSVAVSRGIAAVGAYTEGKRSLTPSSTSPGQFDNQWTLSSTIPSVQGHNSYFGISVGIFE
eukprot:gene26349-34984_t